MDTSALMMPVERDVRLFDELERVLGTPPENLDLIVPAAVRRELAALADGNGTEGVAAAVGEDLATRCRTVETDASHADDALVELAERGECDCVVTNDRPLRDRILERGVRVIGIRGKDKLELTEP